MYQIGDIYNTALIRKPVSTPTNIHILHQHRDQITGVEQKKSLVRKKKRDIVARVNQTLNNRKIAALAQNFLKKNKPIQYGENAVNTSFS
jgi:hypothetical protein